MNNRNIHQTVYKEKVELLLRIMPIIMDQGVFALHGGTAINLFIKDLPRYSVDIDLTYIPVEERSQSLDNINNHLSNIEVKIKRTLRGTQVIHNVETCKLLCEYHGKQVKIEVNKTKRGIIGGEIITMGLSEKAQEQFEMYCEADIVPLTSLYGGKIAAALSRQHPRDLFDVKYMDFPIEKCREGLIFNLLSSDKPIYESLSPNLLDQREAMKNQFEGMSEIEFSYDDFETTRLKLIKEVNEILTESDRDFLINFELGEPDWGKYEFCYFQNYPSIKWKFQNILKLAKSNREKLSHNVRKLKQIFSSDN